ncbi:MAG: TIGR03086 family protein [Nocardioidaceae bacterium]|nr:TIGR03086 family protein [Nocardioidaceae bacterium]NUS52571.1 TIGR03086 family protein [Nocardioidaceae bacterium]
MAGAELLERAVAYTRGSLQLVAGADLAAPTPCRGWDLRALLRHMNDSLAAFTEAAAIGYVDLVPVREDDPGLLLVERLRSRACALVAVWSQHDVDHDRPPSIGVSRSSARPRLRSDLLAAAGALEITAHGWDVARACGADRPVPAALALELLDVVPLLVHDADRPHRFAERVDVPLHSRPSTRLLATLGRDGRPL